MKDGDKTEVLYIFFASVFFSKANFSQGTQPPELGTTGSEMKLL